MLKKMLCIFTLASITLCASQRSSTPPATRQATVKSVGLNLWAEYRNDTYTIFNATEGQVGVKLPFPSQVAKTKYDQSTEKEQTIEVPATPRS